MSYEDTHCPCGDKKPTDTMFCDACEIDLAGRREMQIMKSDADVGTRRHSALILLSLARGRKRRQELEQDRKRKADAKATANAPAEARRSRSLQPDVRREDQV